MSKYNLQLLSKISQSVGRQSEKFGPRHCVYFYKLEFSGLNKHVESWEQDQQIPNLWRRLLRVQYNQCQPWQQYLVASLQRPDIWPVVFPISRLSMKILQRKWKFLSKNVSKVISVIFDSWQFRCKWKNYFWRRTFLPWLFHFLEYFIEIIFICYL